MARKTARTQPAKPKPRASTRRSPKPRAASPPEPRAIVLAPIQGTHRPRRTARAHGAGAPDTVRVTFSLRDVHDRPIHDPEGVFTFRSDKDRRQVTEQARVVLRGADVIVRIPAGGDVVQAEIDLQRYRFSSSAKFFRSPGMDQTFKGALVREPAEWQPSFTPWASQSAHFDALRDALTASKDIMVLDTGRVLPSLADAAYDGVNTPDAVLAKTALLNLYYRLRTAGPPIRGAARWFSFVKAITRIGQERMLAWVRPEMADAVRDVLAGLGEYLDEFERADESLHYKNVPAEVRPRVLDAFSLKSTHRKGNYQLTLFVLSGNEVLLDADIDESGTFWGHARDVFKHTITRQGTHPVDVHEILVRQEGHEPQFDLGYTLT